MTISPAVTASEPDWPAGRRYSAWSKVMLLWAVSVAVYGFVLFLLTQFQFEQAQAQMLADQVAALREGNREMARALTSDWHYEYPTSVLVQFAAVGLAVVATAWLGRRLLALAIPLFVLVSSLAPAYWGDGGLAPQPLGEDDWGYWITLAFSPGTTLTDSLSGSAPYSDLALWPLVLGSALEAGLWLLPLIAAPARRVTTLPAKDVLVRAAIPSTALAVFALALVSAPSADALYRAPFIAFGIGLFATALATTSRPRGVRIAAAIVVPAVVAPIVLSSALDNEQQGWILAVATAASSALALTLTASMSWLRQRVRPVGPDEPVSATA